MFLAPSSAMDTSESGAKTAAFVPEKKSKTASTTDTRKITVPQNRVRPLKTNWKKIFDPIVEMLGLQIRYIATCTLFLNNSRFPSPQSM